MDDSLPEILIILAIVAAAAYFARRSQWPVRIVVDATGVRSQTGIALGRLPVVTQFFQDDVEIVSQLTILARRRPNGSVELRIRGHLDPGTQQQIRNFLLTVL